MADILQWHFHIHVEMEFVEFQQFVSVVNQLHCLHIDKLSEVVQLMAWGQTRGKYYLNQSMNHDHQTSVYDNDHWHNELTHWDRMPHICVSKQIIIGSDNGLSPGRRLAIIWHNAAILLIGPLATYFNEILNEINIFSFNIFENVSSKRRPFCLCVSVLKDHLLQTTKRGWIAPGKERCLWLGRAGFL